MEEKAHQISSENQSLFTLNDDCLGHIVKFLQFSDYVNLAKTCSYLLCVAKHYKQYKNIAVIAVKHRLKPMCTPEFVNELSFIGEQVLSISVSFRWPESLDILEIITRHCMNVRSVEMYAHRGPIPFQNLKELKVGKNVKLSSDDWENCFANNPGIEYLEYCNTLENNVDNVCMPLLAALPKLKSLKIDSIFMKSDKIETQIDHLSGLKSLTKFSFSCSCPRIYVCTCLWSSDVLLKKLAEALNLVELDFVKTCDETAFDSLESFSHLEVLSMGQYSKHGVYGISRHSLKATFPSMLKKIKFRYIKMSCDWFLSIVKQLEFLEEIDMDYGLIFWDNEREYFPSTQPLGADIKLSKIIIRIGFELQAEKRKLKIIFSHFLLKKQVCKYSENLEVIINPQRAGSGVDHTFKLK